MSRTNIDIDDDLLTAVMRRYGMRTKRDAVNYALRRIHVEPMTLEEKLAMRGTGWEGNLDAIRDDDAEDDRHHRGEG